MATKKSKSLTNRSFISHFKDDLHSYDDLTDVEEYSDLDETLANSERKKFKQIKSPGAYKYRSSLSDMPSPIDLDVWRKKGIIIELPKAEKVDNVDYLETATKIMGKALGISKLDEGNIFCDTNMPYSRLINNTTIRPSTTQEIIDHVVESTYTLKGQKSCITKTIESDRPTTATARIRKRYKYTKRTTSDVVPKNEERLATV